MGKVGCNSPAPSNSRRPVNLICSGRGASQALRGARRINKPAAMLPQGGDDEQENAVFHRLFSLHLHHHVAHPHPLLPGCALPAHPLQRVPRHAERGRRGARRHPGRPLTGRPQKTRRGWPAAVLRDREGGRPRAAQALGERGRHLPGPVRAALAGADVHDMGAAAGDPLRHLRLRAPPHGPRPGGDGLRQEQGEDICGKRGGRALRRRRRRG